MGIGARSLSLAASRKPHAQIDAGTPDSTAAAAVTHTDVVQFRVPKLTSWVKLETAPLYFELPALS